ncbi:MAG: transcription elongation factor GreA [Planctomycetia bacterium]|nr:transcription elongation factor GreA [Planctomycetia bacterium]
MSQFLDRAERAMKDQSWDDYEEAWLDAIESGNVKFPDYLTAARSAIANGCEERAGQMLELIYQSGNADTLVPEKKLEFIEALACTLPRSEPMRNLLLDSYKDNFGHIDGFDTCVKNSGLMEGTRPGDVIPLFKRMVHYQPGSFVKHRSGWGVGEVKSLDTKTETAIVDFQKKEGHSMKLEALPQICTPLDHDHFLVVSWRRPEDLKELAEKEPVELIKLALRTSSKPLPLPRVKDLIAGTAIPTSSWSKWWTKTRNALKKEPLIGQTGGKNNELYLLDTPEALNTSLTRKFKGLSPSELLQSIRESLVEVGPDQISVLEEGFTRLRRDVDRGDLPRSERVSALLLLREHASNGQEEMAIGALAMKEKRLSNLLNNITREDEINETLEILIRLNPEEFTNNDSELFLESDDVLRELLITKFKAEGTMNQMHDNCMDSLQQPSKSPLLFLFLARRAAAGNTADFPMLEGISTSDLVRQCLSLLDRLALTLNTTTDDPGLQRTVKRFRQHLTAKPFNLLNKTLDSSKSNDARALYDLIISLRTISDANIEKLKAVILRKFPKVLSGQKVVKVEVSSRDTIYSTTYGMDKVQKELTEIRNEKLPAIFKAIGDAAALGDLSENAEFTSAIEERENLNRKVLELQSELDRAQIIDPTKATTDQVSLGSCVKIFNVGTDSEVTYSILGPWDGGPDDGVISYLSPLGKALLQKRAGEEFEVELPTGTQSFKILEIAQGQIPVAR